MEVDMHDEVWKHITRLPLGYEISSYGNVRINYGTHVEPIASHDSGDGYKVIYIQGFTFKIHHLVAREFVPNPKHKPIVKHLDGDKSNNRADNLSWTSYRENSLRRWNSKQTVGKSVVCKESGQVYSTMLSAAVHLGVPVSCVKASADNGSSCCGLHFQYNEVLENQKGVIYVPETELVEMSKKASSIEEFRKMVSASI